MSVVLYVDRKYDSECCNFQPNCPLSMPKKAGTLEISCTGPLLIFITT